MMLPSCIWNVALRRAGFAIAVCITLAPACQAPAASPQPAASQQPTKAEVIQAAPPRQETTDSTFAHLVAHLSEPGGYFDTDNLISNETSYLHVLGKLRDLNVRGGAYIGVGPDQNFAYIAQIRPRMVFIVDIRRDNLLQHLFFKTLFANARTRIEYLCLLFGKPLPSASNAWNEADLQTLAAYIDETTATQDATEAAHTLVQERARHMGLALSKTDLATISRIHTAFIQAGLGLQFTSHGRAARAYYPTYRDLILEKDLTGRRGSFLAREDDFQFIKTLHAEDLIVPVVGDLSGSHALAAIGAYLTEQDLPVSALYTSNVEFYLMRRNRFDAFAENVKRLPRTDQSVIIRSYFNRFTSSHPQSVPGYASTQLLQTLDTLIDEHERGGYTSYWDLINKHSLTLR